AYNAAKAAMAAFTQTWQLEMPDTKVKIVDFQPADIRTSFNDSIQIDNLQSRYGAALQQTWRIVNANMQAAPPPELVAGRVLQLIDDPDPPPLVTVGNLFQSRLAPFIFRFLPQRLRIWGLKRYYRL
ncbi:MAG: SDR family NAD(P)-dependent oxidoreductase, partial [Verrucomicrobiaceae bacterium]|nr:SDR family NAD(P)-dependent oxidoreductase [Verrucomicrobiaceae bacterium]